MLKIQNLFVKEEQVEYMNLARTKGEQVDDMDPPWKVGVMMMLIFLSSIESHSLRRRETPGPGPGCGQT